MRRRLLSITIESFAGPAYADRPLPFGQLSQRLVAALTADPHRYELIEPPERLDADSIGAAVKQAVRGASGDVVIVHVVSHAEPWGDDVRVVGADGNATPESSVRSWLEHAYGDGLSLQTAPDGGESDSAGPWVLFLLDLVQAGEVGPQPWLAAIADEHRRVWTIAATGADPSAFNARLTQAAAEVLADLGSLDVDPARQYVPLTVFHEAVHRWGQDFGGGGNDQRVSGDHVNVSGPLDLPFFVNPDHSEQARFDGPPDLRAYVSALYEIVDPWHSVTRAAGTAPNADPDLGSCHGRDDELRRLTTWLTHADPRDTATTMLVTGRPGVGKSALLALLVGAAHPNLCAATGPLWRHRSADLPEQPVTNLVAVHARGRNTDQVMDLIGRQCDPAASVSTVDHLVDLLSWQPHPPTIVIDGVDEAVDPAGLVRVLETLGRYNPPLGRLLIGARTGPLWPDTAALLDLAGPDNTIDLDRVDRDVLRRDLTAYAAGMLERDPRYRGPDQAEARHALATTVGQRLTEPATDTDRAGWGEFLLARLFIQCLRHREPAAAQAVAEQLPVTLPGLIDLDPHVDPLGRAVLTTLAYGFGDGLPRALLRDCVPVFAGRPVTAPELDDALDRLSFYLGRGVDEHGVRTYRPVHHAITEHLGDPPDRPPTADARQHHAALLDHLLARLRPQPDAPPDWSAANPYVLRHAVDHAARGGRVDELLTDLEFLVHADPTTLRHHLDLASSEAARANATVYRTTLASQAPTRSHRRGLLRLDAARQAQTDPVAAQPDPTAGVVLTLRWATLTQDGAGHRHTLAGHGGQVWAVATMVLPDGTPVAVTASIDTTARVWDLATGQPRHTLTGHTAPVTAVATVLLPDGTPVVVTTSADGTARVWDLATGRARHTLAGHTDWVRAVATMLLPDGTPVVVTTSDDQTARVWDLTSGESRHILAGHTQWVGAVATTLLPDGTPVAVTTSHDQTARVWDLTTGQLRHTLTGHTAPVTAVATMVLPDGTPVAVTASGDTTVRVWDLASGQLRHTETGHMRPVRAVATMRLPDGTAVAATTGDDTLVRVWDLASGDLRHILAGHTEPIWAVAMLVLPDGSPVAVTTSIDGTGRVWDLTRGRSRHILAGHTSWPRAVATVVLPDGTPVAVTASDDATARVWDLTVDESQPILTGHTRLVRSLAAMVLPDGSSVAVSTSDDQTARVWDLTTGRARHILTGHTDSVTAVATLLLPDGTPVAVTTSEDQTARVWDLTTGESRHILVGHTHWVVAVATLVLPDGTPVAVTAGVDPTARVWDLATGQLRHVLTGHAAEIEEVVTMVLPDGTPIAVTTSLDATARIWDLATGQSRHTLTDHGGPVRSVATLLLPDGTPVAVTTSDDATARVWDLTTGQPRHTLVGHPKALSQLVTTVLPDGTPVAVASGYGETARVWDLTSGELRHVLVGHTDWAGVEAALLLPDGTPVAITTSADGEARVWDLTTGHQLAVQPTPYAVNALSTLGTHIIVGFDQEVACFDIGSGPAW